MEKQGWFKGWFQGGIRCIRLRQRFGLALVGFVGVLLFAACSPDQATSPTPASPTDPAQPSVLRVAINPAFPPFEMKAADGSLTGFDIDLINAIGGTAGFIIDFDEMVFDDLIRSIYGNQTDVAISAITINRDRAERVSFSRPYFKSGLAIAVAANNTDITSVQSLQGKRIGVQRGTTSEAQSQAIPNAKVRQTASAPEALQALAKGEVDAVINDAPVTTYLINSGAVPGLKLIAPPLTEEYYGIATPKDSPNLEKINAALTTLFNNGTYAQIYKKWFATEPPQLPETAPI
ncbi:basic amino acid ABC transporter substrate-binding protein [Leptolyngbya sp. NK1-12]|uniref:Basic amino acid ABC transporter substrate-binding protein n=1 Tax=Leptolyngbya sp. NK1-12 TaxID=2547451 RepID=A0AA96WCB7_9CYAN|nr:basic amino acid ABC transporter substrate-binding protein [Leptolyngbya sp. NK1-12]WNZ23692.1 basic amino acid ABC transporter substrate-binding protein [Leptolyngbya sp. NK1-12]